MQAILVLMIMASFFFNPEYSELLEQMAIPSDSKLRKLDKKHIPFLRKHREIFGFE